MISQTKILLFVCCLLPLLSVAQNEEYVDGDPFMVNHDYIYKDHIKSVKFHLKGLMLSYPIIDLNSGATLVLRFDDLEEDISDYYYKIIHCNADWQPSDLNDMDYINGFSSDVINNYDFSFNTLTNYTHYSLELPNQTSQFTKSGNYLLHIYANNDEEDLVLTRRFMVVEPIMRIGAQFKNTGMVSKIRTHQEIDFVVNHKGIRISNPYQEVKMAVLQNGRWDNAITGLKPLFIRENELIYDYQDKIVFPAGKEFRHVSLRSFRYRTDRVARIVEDPVDKIHVQLLKDQSRQFKSYIFNRDANGGFIIENEHETDDNLQADYAYVHFFLESNFEREDGDIYLFGAMTDWQIQDKFKLEYKPNEEVYYAKVRLKQGFYNYNYAFVRGAGATPDLTEYEGNWYETENDYQILIYHRPPGGRYDRLVAVQSLNSSNR